MLDRSYQFVVGSYTDYDALPHLPAAAAPGRGITRMTIHHDGHLTRQGIEPAENPAVLIEHPNGQWLYAVVETILREGNVLRYDVDRDKGLTLLDEFGASGRATCYLSLAPDCRSAIIINYWDAMIDVVDVDADGALGPLRQSFRQGQRSDGEWRQVTDREDHWANRQVGPHAHCAHFWHDWVFIPDLGENAVFQYRWNVSERTLEFETAIEFDPGSGPRHMVLHPTLSVCYISNELINSVCAATLDATDPGVVKPRLRPFQYLSTIDDETVVSYVSEIALAPHARSLYVSNRGGNSIAHFAVGADGSLARAGLTPTNGRTPRHFAITPCGCALVVANQDSGNIRVFGRDLETGALTPTEHSFDVDTPSYVRFLAG